jgi:hypothetical protein
LRGEYTATRADATSRTVSGAKQAAASAIDNSAGAAERQCHHPLRDDGGTLPDKEALKAFQNRLEEIRDELEKARELADESQTEKLEREWVDIQAEIRKAQGPGKRGPLSVDTKNVRNAVRKAIKESIEKTSGSDPNLGTHLRNCIHLHDRFSYEPEKHISWDA